MQNGSVPHRYERHATTDGAQSKPFATRQFSYASCLISSFASRDCVSAMLQRSILGGPVAAVRGSMDQGMSGSSIESDARDEN